MGQLVWMSIVFIGDIHRDWRPIIQGLDRLDQPPVAAVLMGDIECTAPLDELAPSFCFHLAGWGCKLCA